MVGQVQVVHEKSNRKPLFSCTGRFLYPRNLENSSFVDDSKRYGKMSRQSDVLRCMSCTEIVPDL